MNNEPKKLAHSHYGEDFAVGDRVLVYQNLESEPLNKGTILGVSSINVISMYIVQLDSPLENGALGICHPNTLLIRENGEHMHQKNGSCIQVWYSIVNAGDGSAYPIWFLSEKEALTHQESEEEEGWGEPCYGSVETFEGADIHLEALVNSGNTTISFGSTTVPVVREAYGTDGINLTLFTSGVEVYGKKARKLGWNGKDPIIWSWDGRELKTFE